MKLIQLLLIACILCSFSGNKYAETKKPGKAGSVSLIILGTIQDAGSPQAGCKKDCCKDLFAHPDKSRMVVSLGLVDQAADKKYLFEATPDFTRQIKALNLQANIAGEETPDAIFLTHAHIGHYTGLMYLGKEAMNTAGIPVFAMPRMQGFLQQNGPWSQLLANKNIELKPLQDSTTIALTNSIQVMPFRVPHRDEFSETVGYCITGPHKKALFIPDIDKWEKWGVDISRAIAGVDYAFVDGTFFDAAEINNRDISTIPHPFIIESMKRFAGLPASEKKKIFFIHFNHTNPVINKNSSRYRQVIQNGFNIAAINSSFAL